MSGKITKRMRVETRSIEKKLKKNGNSERRRSDETKDMKIETRNTGGRNVN